jgi:hypothetical protein
MLRTRSIYFHIGAVLLTILVALAGCAGDSDKGGQQTAESASEKPAMAAREGYQIVEVNGITFEWKTSGDVLEGVMEADTDGWIAVGFDPSKGMQDANIIIGYVEDSAVFIRDDFGTWFTSHGDDEELGGTKDVSILGGSEIGGKTVIEFSIPLNSQDTKDKPLIPGNEYSIILAYGTKDDFKGMHRKKGKAEIRL